MKDKLKMDNKTFLKNIGKKNGITKKSMIFLKNRQ